MAGRSSRPFSVQAGGPGLHDGAGRDAPSLSCSAIAWCRLGSNGVPIGSSCLMPLRSRMPRKLRSMPSRPSRTLANDLRLAVGGRRQAVEAAVQVLGRLHHVGANFCTAYWRRLVHLALGAGADVGGLRLGAHPAVLHLRQFGLQFGDAGGGGLHHLLRRLRQLGEALLFAGLGSEFMGIGCRCSWRDQLGCMNVRWTSVQMPRRRRASSMAATGEAAVYKRSICDQPSSRPITRAV